MSRPTNARIGYRDCAMSLVAAALACGTAAAAAPPGACPAEVRVPTLEGAPDAPPESEARSPDHWGASHACYRSGFCTVSATRSARL
jgi:hypothetical protein